MFGGLQMYITLDSGKQSVTTCLDCISSMLRKVKVSSLLYKRKLKVSIVSNNHMKQ